MNFVERTTWELLQRLLADIDPNHNGWCIDAGAGVQDFYFEWFADAGYATLLIEPVPVQQVQAICENRDIPLLKMALADRTELLELAIHKDPNRHTLRADLWPADYHDFQPIGGVTLVDIVEAYRIQHITALKLDIEGAEPQVLRTLTPDLMPDVIVFEFGGQVSKAHGTGAWSNETLLDVFQATRHLRDIGYRDGLIIAVGAGEHIRPLNFGTPDFKMTDGWGNIIITKEAELCRTLAY